MSATYTVSFVSRTPNSGASPTLSEVEGIKWTGLSYEEDLAEGGRIDVAARVDSLADDIKTRLRNPLATPNEIWVTRDDERVAAGPLTSYTIQGPTITLYAPGLKSYLAYMLRDTDYAANGVDQALIVKALIDEYQAQSYGHFGLDTTGMVATGITRDLTLPGREGKQLASVIKTMGERENGFDISVDPESRRVTLHHPRRGTDLSTEVFLDRRNVTDPRLSVNVGPGMVASDVLATSSSADGAALTATAGTASVRTAFGRVMLAKAWTDISLQATLEDHADRFASDVATAVISLDEQELLPVEGAGIDDFNVGDIVTYDYDAGLGAQTITPRVRTKRVMVRKGREELAVRFV